MHGTPSVRQPIRMRRELPRIVQRIERRALPREVRENVLEQAGQRSLRHSAFALHIHGMANSPAKGCPVRGSGIDECIGEAVELGSKQPARLR